MLSRRTLLRRLSMFPFVGGLVGSGLPLPSLASPVRRDYFKELGIRTFINAAGTYTGMTGSLMRKEALDAINGTSTEFVMLDELHDKVGARIATLLKCEAATVTSGCFAAITLGLAGVLTGMDEKKVEQLPHLEGTGMKTEVIMQKAHDIVYSHALRNCGVKIIQVETRQQLEQAINSQTAMLWYLNANANDGQITHQEFVDIGRKYKVPTMIDCAADVPPVENLWKFTQMGFDLVCFSGGKAIRGPQSAGLLLGRKDLIAAARLSTPPRGNTIGRGLKVNKEEVIGMLVALETFLTLDHAKQWQQWESQIGHIGDAVKSLAGVQTKVDVPPLANHTPTLIISWDTSKVRISGDELKLALRNGQPSIEVAGGGANSVNVTAWVMIPGQEKIVATRLREALTKASA